MQRSVIALHLGIVGSFLLWALLFSWPLPLHLSDAFLGPPGSDLGVYVWNLWVFRHELVAHHASPFFTLEILSLTPPLPLTLQNYTTLSNVLGFFLVPLFGMVTTFNALTIFNSTLSAYAMFLLALRRTHDVAAAHVAGLLFGFSPFMSARSVEHLSLTQAAALPVFGLVMLRAAERPTPGLSAMAGLVVAWAFLCDPYYAVYCLLMLAFTLAYSLVSVDFRPEPLRRDRWTTILDVALLLVVGLIVGRLVGGGAEVRILGLRLSLHSLYTPILLLTLLVAVRGWLAVRPRFTYVLPSWRVTAMVAGPGALVMALVLTPVLYTLFASASSAFPGPGAIRWRNSAPGLDVTSYLALNPFHPWFGWISASWFARQPNGFTENVASIPFVAVLTLIAATVISRRWAPRYWITFTGFFALLSLGPFIVIGGVMTYIPGPWALLRYLPPVSAARMPTRMSVLVLLGVAMLLAMAVHVLRSRSRWRWAITATITVLLALELMPAPRPLYSARVPRFYRIVAADSRPVRVMHLPFGLRDGTSSAGNGSAEYQYHQTAHEKPLVGGYVSRLPRGEVDRYRRLPVMSVLIELSEGRPPTAERRAAAIATARERQRRLRIGWVVVDSRTTSAALEQFAIDAFDLRLVARDEPWRLYRASLEWP